MPRYWLDNYNKGLKTLMNRLWYFAAGLVIGMLWDEVWFLVGMFAASFSR
jgi:hypothetical protein